MGPRSLGGSVALANLQPFTSPGSVPGHVRDRVSCGHSALSGSRLLCGVAVARIPDLLRGTVASWCGPSRHQHVACDFSPSTPSCATFSSEDLTGRAAAWASGLVPKGILLNGNSGIPLITQDG